MVDRCGHFKVNKTQNKQTVNKQQHTKQTVNNKQNNE